MLALLALTIATLVLISLPFIFKEGFFLFLGAVSYLIILYIALSSLYTVIEMWRKGLYREEAYKERMERLEALSRALHKVRVTRK